MLMKLLDFFYFFFTSVVFCKYLQVATKKNLV